MNEGVPESERELLNEESLKISNELDGVILQKSDLEKKMREMDNSTASPEETNKLEEEIGQVRSKFVELTNRQEEISNRLVELKNN